MVMYIYIYMIMKQLYILSMIYIYIRLGSSAPRTCHTSRAVSDLPKWALSLCAHGSPWYFHQTLWLGVNH